MTSGPRLFAWVSHYILIFRMLRAMLWRRERTEDQDVKNQDDEAEDATAGAVLPGVSGGRGSNVTDWGTQGEGSQTQLEEEEVEDDVEHLAYVVSGLLEVLRVWAWSVHEVSTVVGRCERRK